MWTRTRTSLIVVVAVLGTWTTLVATEAADRDALEMSPPSSRPETVERDLYPYRPAAPHARGFVWPFTKSTRNGELGVAGWTTPNVPTGSRGAGNPDDSGWLGFGFAAEWGRPGRDRVPN